MQIASHILVRKPLVGRADWRIKPGADLGSALDHQRRMAAQIAKATAAFFDHIRSIPIDQRALLSKAVGQRKRITCAHLNAEQQESFDRLVDDHIASDVSAAEIDALCTRSLVGMIAWIDGLPQDFRDVLYGRIGPLAKTDATALTKKQRQKLTRQMRLVQRAFYRTTPFSGLAGIAMFHWNGTTPAALAAPKPTPTETPLTSASVSHVALNLSYDPESMPCRYLIAAGQALEEVELSNPTPVRRAAKALNLGYAPRATPPSAALAQLKLIGVAHSPDVLNPVAAPFTCVPADQADVKAVVGKIRHASALWRHVAALAPFRQGEQLRAWCAKRYAGRRVTLRRLMLECREVPRDDGGLPPLSQAMLGASISEQDTVTLQLPKAETTSRRASVTAKLMLCDENSALILNGLLPGGKRQVSRYLAHPEWRETAHLDRIKTPLLLRPLMGRNFQNTPGFMADVLYIPGEPFDPLEPQVDPRDVFVEFRDGIPLVIGPNGKQYQPVYCGCVREQALHPALQVLLALGDGPICETRDRLLHTHLMLDQQLLHLGLPLPKRRPRIVAHDVIVQRRRWAVSADDLPLRRNFPSLGEWMIALHDWRAVRGIPVRASAQALSRDRYEYGQTPRAFVDFACPASAMDLVSVLRAKPSDWLTFEELLPDPKNARGTAEYFVELEI